MSAQPPPQGSGLTGDLRPCDLCHAEVDKANLTYAYRVNAHDLESERAWEQMEQYCPACAESEAELRSYGKADAAFVPSLEAGACWLFGGPVSVQWIQGDEHVILIHVRRA